MNGDRCWAYAPDLEERIGRALAGETHGWWYARFTGVVDDEGNPWFLLLAFEPDTFREVYAAAVAVAPEDAGALLSWEDEPPADAPAIVPEWRGFADAPTFLEANLLQIAHLIVDAERLLGGTQQRRSN